MSSSSKSKKSSPRKAPKYRKGTLRRDIRCFLEGKPGWISHATIFNKFAMRISDMKAIKEYRYRRSIVQKRRVKEMCEAGQLIPDQDNNKDRNGCKANERTPEHQALFGRRAIFSSILSEGFRRGYIDRRKHEGVVYYKFIKHPPPRKRRSKSKEKSSK